MITIEPIVATDHIEAMAPLWVDHREELTTNKELMVLKPDMETYIRLEDGGHLLSLGAFDGNLLVGYSLNINHPMLHYADVMACQNDVLYLDPAYRLGSAGLRLIRATERAAKEAGCDIMLWHAKYDTSLFALLEKMKYRTQEAIFTRVL
jgi:GNAT superfamily N-acetyltransferase